MSCLFGTFKTSGEIINQLKPRLTETEQKEQDSTTHLNKRKKLLLGIILDKKKRGGEFSKIKMFNPNLYKKRTVMLHELNNTSYMPIAYNLYNN